MFNVYMLGEPVNSEKRETPYCIVYIKLNIIRYIYMCMCNAHCACMSVCERGCMYVCACLCVCVCVYRRVFVCMRGHI